MRSQRTPRLGSIYRPRLEALEDRLVPAFSVWQSGSTLFMKGTPDYDSAQILDLGSNNINITLFDNNNVPTVFQDFFGVNRIRIDARSGNDSILYLASRANGISPQMSIYADMGSGDDTFAASIITGDMVDSFSSGTSSRYFLNFQVKGGNGNDNLSLNLDTYINSQSSVSANFDGEKGDDNIAVFFSGDNDGTVRSRLKGGSGNDLLTGILGGDPNEPISMTNRGTIAFAFDGDSGHDDLLMNATLADGSILVNDGTIQVGMQGGNGNDTIEVGDFSLSQGAVVENYGTFDLNVDGSSGNDVIRLFSNADLFSALYNEGKISISVSGGSGNDNINGTVGLAADTTDAYFRIRVKGDSGTDYITLAAFPYGTGAGKTSASILADSRDQLWITEYVKVLGGRKSNIHYIV